ncbi:MAG: aldolase [Lachnospiraceae bacterium]|nr:aldolase [Lachnospiraceae bacterium]
MPLKLMYITNNPEVAIVAQKYGVDRVWIDLETIGKEERQKGLDAVKSHHTVNDIRKIKPQLTSSEMLVRINHWYEGSIAEIDEVIDAGADMIMLPYWKTVDEVKKFTEAVHGRCKTTLLLETKEAVDITDDILAMGGFDEIHIGLNDLHLSYGLTFMFELLANGTVEMLCNKFKAVGIPYGFGGIAKLGDGLLPAEKVIMEHYRLGSTRAILSRTFCDNAKIESIEEIDRVFRENMKSLRDYEQTMSDMTEQDYLKNKADVVSSVNEVVERIKHAKRMET